MKQRKVSPAARLIPKSDWAYGHLVHMPARGKSGYWIKKKKYDPGIPMFFQRLAAQGTLDER
jgi:hypothetical protein